MSTAVSTTFDEPAALRPSVVSVPDLVDGPGYVPVTSQPPRTAQRWMRWYQATLVGVDFASAVIASVLAFVIRYVGADATASLATYIALIVLPVGWVLAVGLNRAYESRFVGVGADEFQRVLSAFLYLTAAVAITSYVTKTELARGFVGGALLLAITFDLIGRFTARKILHRMRARGLGQLAVVIVGAHRSITELAAVLRRDTSAGMTVVGACVPVEMMDDPILRSELKAAGIRLLGDIDSVPEVVAEYSADVVAVTSSEQIGYDRLRWISWQLENCAADLIVAPGLTDVAGSRLHIRPVGGLPLLHVGRPEFAGWRRVVKGLLDRGVALLAVLALSPIFALIALLIRLDSPGRAIFVQTRIGRNGRTFRVVKFRSMFVDAEARKAELRAQNESDGLLFKMKDDPRVTRVGKFLRRTSLDELPQLLNVLSGSMSLVGPRPPLPEEVSAYGDSVRRRLLVKPGVTGLWQVSGRSDLSWEDSVRLDLRYVENWSLSMDLMVLWKTARAVLKADGAY